jgi:hypothetical protein
MRHKFLDRCAGLSLILSERMGVWARCRHFTFIVDGSRIVCTGTNTRKTHPANLMYSYVNRKMEPISSFVGTHSEMRAVLSLGLDKCRGLTLVNVRVDRNGKLALSKPCVGCMDMIEKAKFGVVFHTDNNGQFVRLDRTPNHLVQKTV